MNLKSKNDGWKSRIALLPGVLVLSLLAFAPLRAQADAAFVSEAIEKTQAEPTPDGKWQVTATVAFTSENSGKMVAVGPVNVDSTGEGLQGTLPMTLNDNPTGSNALALSVNKNGTVSIQWLINGKPYLGRQALIFEATAFPDYLSKKLNWGGAVRSMKLTLATEMVKPKPPKIRVRQKEKTKNPIGKRYKLDGRLVVTNSEDGFLDNTCEITGILKYRQQAPGKNGVKLSEIPCVTIITQDANKGFTLDFDKNIYLDDIFAKPETKYFKIRSSIYDRDSGGGPFDDAMSAGETRLWSMETAATRGEFNLPGDRDSENVEVYYTVTAMEDLY